MNIMTTISISTIVMTILFFFFFSSFQRPPPPPSSPVVSGHKCQGGSNSRNSNSFTSSLFGIIIVPYIRDLFQQQQQQQCLHHHHQSLPLFAFSKSLSLVLLLSSAMLLPLSDPFVTLPSLHLFSLTFSPSSIHVRPHLSPSLPPPLSITSRLTQRWLFIYITSFNNAQSASQCDSK